MEFSEKSQTFDWPERWDLLSYLALVHFLFEKCGLLIFTWSLLAGVVICQSESRYRRGSDLARKHVCEDCMFILDHPTLNNEPTKVYQIINL